MTDTPMSRRRLLTYSVGTGVGLYLLGSFVDRSVAPPYPPLMLPSTYTGLTADRLRNLHRRYDAVRTAQGVPAVRQRIIADLHGYRGYEPWLEAVAEWIDLAGWADAADLLVDAAEIGGPGVRRNAAALLTSRATPLLVANSYGPRVVRLEQLETDPAAKSDWRDLRRTLGV
jgi:hypothetical protein